MVLVVIVLFLITYGKDHNMKYLKMTLLLFIAINANTYAQDTAKIRKDAQALVQATKMSDFKTVVKFTYPPVVKSLGGPDKMIEVLNKSLAEMKNQGASIIGGDIGRPGKILHAGTKLYSVVPEKVIIESNGTRLYANSSLLAISLNNGDTWYFIDAGNMSDIQVKQAFPEIYGKLTIPKRSDPVVMGQ